MSRMFRVLLIVALLAAALPVLPVAAGSPRLLASGPLPPPLDQCSNGVQSSGALYFICVPPQWNGDLVIFAHGYVAPQEPLIKFVEQLILADGTTIPELVLSQGYAFATTSYRKNGLAVKEGLADLVDLVDVFKAAGGQAPQHVYLIGASEGGLITTLAAEKHPQTFSGGLAMCGPIGSFQGQINYWGDFRVLFDYFFPHQLPGIPIQIPTRLMSAWKNVYFPQIASLIGNPDNQQATWQLLNTSYPELAQAYPNMAIDTTVGILSYNVFATNEARDELGGQPFDNRNRLYSGSDNDRALNKPGGVQRFAADEAALLEISRYYETTGDLKVPLVTMHTLYDPIVPYWHEEIYNTKSPSGGSAPPHINMPIDRYGHCTFTTGDAMTAFGALVSMVTGAP